MILDVGQNCDLKPTYPKSYQNHIKIVSKPYQNRIKTVSKSWENHREKKKHQKIDQKFVPEFFLVPLFEANSLEPYQNRIKIISKSYRTCIKIVSKP